ncbi:prepilin-type N-terminal cleavage/methylation domain-containing protein [Candidatus Sumerlaeota bacterium]|nr:prepilin-type N-terminal cleavage/methylation domain-containing protein [Candidatus Sumerlaeota bacterium]
MKLRTQSGFSIIELLIALVIIGILTSVAISRIANRAEEARQKAAMSDLKELARAQEHVSIDTGFLFRLHVLNDSNGGDATAYDPDDPSDLHDGILRERYQTLVGNPLRIFIDAEDGTQLSTPEAALQFDLLSSNETNFSWKGPYINWQVVDIETKLFPADPWGTPYLLFTDAGMMVEPAGRMEDGTSFAGIFAQLSTASWGGTEGNKFDRPTLVSLGRDGLPGDNGASAVGTGDDLTYQF